jgi:hypothetical protein
LLFFDLKKAWRLSKDLPWKFSRIIGSGTLEESNGIDKEPGCENLL